MNRHTVRFMLLLLALLVVAPFFIPGPDGQAIMTWDRFTRQFMKSLPANLPREPPSLPSNKQQTVYQWKDEKGVWHFTNQTPPANAREVKVVEGQVNIMPAVKPPREEAGAAPLPAVPGVPTPDAVRQALDEARKARDSANQYNQNLDKAVNNM